MIVIVDSLFSVFTVFSWQQAALSTQMPNDLVESDVYSCSH